MEPWRIFATALFVAAGVTLVLLTMAKVRERTHSGGQTAVAGAIGLAAMLVIGVLLATTLPAAVSWTIVVAAGVVVTTMVLAS